MGKFNGRNLYLLHMRWINYNALYIYYLYSRVYNNDNGVVKQIMKSIKSNNRMVIQNAYVICLCISYRRRYYGQLYVSLQTN